MYMYKMTTAIQYYKFSDNRQHDYTNFIAYTHSKKSKHHISVADKYEVHWCISM